MSHRFIRMRFPDFKDRAVTLSYDDGGAQDIRLANLLSSYGMKCTFNLNGYEFSQSILRKDICEEHLFPFGHEIAVHGMRHLNQGIAYSTEGIKDILDCRLELEKEFGRIITGSAYAGYGIRRYGNGQTYENIKAYLSMLGITYARALAGDNDDFDLPEDWYAWMPSAHHNNPLLPQYIEKFLAIEIKPIDPVKLFYLWGHSSEFEKDNNWHVIEDFCEKLKGHDNIWFANNSEICEYTKAHNSLVLSADGSMVYNPTLIRLFFTTENDRYVINPGETLTI